MSNPEQPPLTRREARAAEESARRENETDAPARPMHPHAVATAPIGAAPVGAAPLPVAPARAAPAAARSISRRALGFATFGIVGGLFATAAIPAYGARSAAGAASTGSAASGSTQKLTVSANAAASTAVRDVFAAPTPEQLDAAKRQASILSTAGNGSYTTVQSQAVGDDYPWPHEATDDQGGGLSPLMYYFRECVDFVAWRFNRDAGATSAPWKYTWSNITPDGGSAYEWPANWSSKGWATSNTPIVGCAAWFGYNHVAYVQSVNGDGTVLIEEYNYGGKHSYGTRTLSVGEIPLFLYPPGN